MEDRTRHQDHHAGPAHEADRGSHTAMYRGSAVAATTDHHDHATQNDHVVQGSGQHAGHGTARFKNRFWLALALSVPVVYFSPMCGHLLGSMPPVFPGSTWIPPVLGTVIFLYGGQPFLKGGLNELRSRQPGMMLLIGMAVSVAFVASWATSLGIGGWTWTSGGTGPAGRDHAAGPLD